MKTVLIRLLLLFYLSSSYLGATHIHHKALESIDCKVHILVKNLNSGDFSSNSIELFVCFNCFEVIRFWNIQSLQPIIKGFNAQAPPHYS